jgi:hypothetical protein
LVAALGRPSGKLRAAKTLVPSADTAKKKQEFVIGITAGFQEMPELVEV